MLELEHLADYIELYTSALEARANAAAADDTCPALEAVRRSTESIVSRETAHPDLLALETFRRLGLTETEQQVLWFLASIGSSQRARSLLPRALGEVSGALTLHGIRIVVYGEAPSRRAIAELSASGPLRRWALIERADVADVHESRQTWCISARLLAVLHGGNALDPNVSSFTRMRDGRSSDPVVARDCNLIEVSDAISQGAIMVVAGAPGIGRRTLVTRAAHRAGRTVLEADCRELMKDPLSFRNQLRSIVRECKLLACVPLIANLDALDEERLNLIDEVVAEIDGPVLATCGTSRPAVRWCRAIIVVEMAKPSSAQLGELWLRKLGQGTQSDAELLATRYPLAPALIHHAAEAAKARAAGRELTPDDIYAGIRTVLDDKLGQFARRVTVTQTWDDIVLPEDQLEAVQELIARVRGRRRVYEQWGFANKVGKGLGVSALFSGPPGTGKTMVAALIAKELGLELYQVDLGKIVSKWIGETEKNLGALFDAAEAGHAILLFDEADALFGKRTDVKSSNDRNANMETNYLLQRLESFTGICLLTSNHESHIDPAFQRRLSLHLRFELPDVDERAMLWRAMLPAAAPVAPDVDVDALAKRYVMSGGYIRNAALRAAFIAADTDSPITAAHLERAARCEYEGMGKIA
jgi:hypothetical protein